MTCVIASGIFTVIISTQSLLLILYVLAPGLQATNVAVDKPAYQSSTWPSGSGVADNAVDGSSSLSYEAGTCAHTGDGDTDPWWMVDLLGRYEITNVTIRSRDIYPMQNLIVEVFTQNPNLCPTSATKNCTTFPGRLGAVETLTCDLPMTGRFMKIRKGTPGAHLTFCEVEVSGTAVAKDCWLTVFQRVEGKRYQISAANSHVTIVPRVECAANCRQNNCLGLNYESSTGACEMILKLESQDQLVDSAGWVYYGDDVC